MVLYPGVFLIPSGEAEDDLGRQLYTELREFFRRCAADSLLQNTDTLRWGGLCAIPLSNCYALGSQDVMVLKRKLRELAGHSDPRWKDGEGTPAWRIQGSAIHSDCSQPQQKHPHAYVHFGDKRLQSTADELEALLDDISVGDSKIETIKPNQGRGGRRLRRKGFSLELVHLAAQEDWKATGPITLQSYEAVTADLPLASALLQLNESLDESVQALLGMHWELCLASFGKAEGSHHMRLDAMYPY
jgi:hypothetical protein